MMINTARKKFSLKFFLTLLTLVFLLSFTFLVPAFAAQRMAVKVELANVRSAPDKKSDIAWQVTRYHPFQIIKKQGNWYKCKDFEGDSGWIYKTLLNKTATVITIKENCNVRSGPATKNRILFIVDREVPLKVLKRQGRWLQVMHEDGDKGWIHASLVW